MSILIKVYYKSNTKVEVQVGKKNTEFKLV